MFDIKQSLALVSDGEKMSLKINGGQYVNIDKPHIQAVEISTKPNIQWFVTPYDEIAIPSNPTVTMTIEITSDNAHFSDEPYEIDKFKTDITVRQLLDEALKKLQERKVNHGTD